MMKRHAYPYEPWGPWIGVRPERQHLCAIKDCEIQGKAHVCPADSTKHHHGCIHYERSEEELYTKHRLQFRQGWGLLCDAHYKIVHEILGRK